MTFDMRLRREALVNNPTARVAVCLCLDTSGSMSGEPIAELAEGVGQFFAALRDDEVARYAAEVAVVTFGDSVRRLVDFGSKKHAAVPTFETGGSTPMGEGVGLALDLLESRKTEYAQAGIDYYQPWLVLMTDGQPTDNIEAAARRTATLIAQDRLTIFPVGIGPDAKLGELRRFSPCREPLRLKGLAFGTFFAWLSRSVARVSQSIPGQSVPLDEREIRGWAEL